jgi:aminoglycoside phosphotransferase family enzyme/predicted kinase
VRGGEAPVVGPARITETARVQTSLIDGLLRPSAYPHETSGIRLVETHISWILLTGDHAYKLKKPVDVGFLDFSTLERRRHFCHEELRLNRRLVPELYLDVVEIRGPLSAPTIGPADGTPPGDVDAAVLDYAVHMRQFDTSRQLDLELEAGTLMHGDMAELARTVSAAHAGAPRAEAGEAWGTPEKALEPVEANFVAIRRAAPAPEMLARVDRLETHARSEGERLAPQIRARKADGFVRECHGDLHLSNLVRLEAGIRAFDCIEFAPGLRWIDVASDSAFLIMDLQVRERDDLAFEYANEYLEITGDYGSTQLLDFYLGYRSLVRAKVAALRLQDSALTRSDRAQTEAKLERHVALAERYARPRPLGVVAMRGLSGSGKSWLARQLLAPLEAFRVRSDVERKRLEGLDRLERSGSPTDGGIYTPGATHATYERLGLLAETVVGGGYVAIVDATHTRRAQRDVAREAAARAGVPFIVVDCRAPTDVLQQRVSARAEAGGDASEAGTEVLARQIETAEDVAPAEFDALIEVDTGTDVDVAALAKLVRDACRPAPANGR